jgi:diguanylate cyclase (GGDEF)-like protein
MQASARPARFPPEVETQYLERRSARQLPLLRSVCAIAPVLYLGYVFWDLRMDPSVVGQTLPLRIAGAAIFLLAYALTFIPAMVRHLSWLLQLSIVCVTLGVSLILLRVPGGFVYGLPGLIFGTIANLTLAPSLGSAMIGYALLLGLPNGVMWAGGVPAFVLVNANLFLVPLNLLAAWLSYLLDARSREAFRVEREYERLASVDPLTGILNRGRFMELAEQELLRAKRYERPLTVIALDIDRFKGINDAHGHGAGDAVLQAVARSAEETLRSMDLLGRLGGDEFAAILPETSSAQAVPVAERLRLALQELAVDDREQAVHFTVSIGLAGRGPEDETLESLLRRADDALYASKQAGRNRVVAAPPAAAMRFPQREDSPHT